MSQKQTTCIEANWKNMRQEADQETEYKRATLNSQSVPNTAEKYSHRPPNMYNVVELNSRKAPKTTCIN
jgi:hypothetical protein